MASYEIKQTLFQGRLRPDPGMIPERKSLLELSAGSEKPLLYAVLSQSRTDLEDVHNSPSISMWEYLVASAQVERLNEISIYAEQGTTSEQIRFLYLNDIAIEIWRAMDKPTRILGRLHRPPRTAVLTFGVPFSE